MIVPRLVELGAEEDLAIKMSAVGLSGGRPVLVAIGGASGLTGAAEQLARRIVEQIAVPAAIECEAAIADGGTDSGVMRLVGKAHAEAGAPTLLVGVAVRHLIRLPE